MSLKAKSIIIEYYIYWLWNKKYIESYYNIAKFIFSIRAKIAILKY